MITLKVKKLQNFWKKSRGLIGAHPAYAVFFTTRWGIHTFGVPSPIDVLILDDGYRVVKLTRGLPPNRIFFWNPIYQNVVELPQGTISKHKISVGDPVTLLYRL